MDSITLGLAGIALVLGFWLGIRVALAILRAGGARTTLPADGAASELRDLLDVLVPAERRSKSAHRRKDRGRK